MNRFIVHRSLMVGGVTFRPSPFHQEIPARVVGDSYFQSALKSGWVELWKAPQKIEPEAEPLPTKPEIRAKDILNRKRR
jgi:hypothetical protein